MCPLRATCILASLALNLLIMIACTGTCLLASCCWVAIEWLQEKPLLCGSVGMTYGSLLPEYHVEKAWEDRLC